MRTPLFVICTLLNLVLVDGTDILDCSLSYSVGFEVCSNGVYCYPPYECCGDGRACCYEGPKHELYSAAEVTGLVLCTTSIATSLILALFICGASYCSNREDKSHIFGKK